MLESWKVVIINSVLHWHKMAAPSVSERPAVYAPSVSRCASCVIGRYPLLLRKHAAFASKLSTGFHPFSHKVVGEYHQSEKQEAGPSGKSMVPSTRTSQHQVSRSGLTVANFCSSAALSWSASLNLWFSSFSDVFHR